MKAKNRLTAILVALALLIGLLPVMAPDVNAAISTSTFAAKVQSFINDSRWKSGTAWGDSQKPKLSSWSSTGCCAYAADFAAYVYGSASAAWTGSDFTKFTNLNEIRAGDIIHISNHWFVVLERNGDTFRTAEGNFDDKVRVCSDGWGIKNGKIYNLKASSSERTFEYGYHYKFSDGSSTTGYSSSQIYHKIDMSAAVLASRTNQQVSGDCAVVSMATVEAFLYGATSAADKKTVYNALVSKNGDNDYAYWSNCGYVSHNSINWTTVYDNLSKGYPVIVHRPASGNNAQHWAVVAGYKGSTTTLEKDKFVIVNVYRGSGGTDYYYSGDWRGSVTIDRMVTRKNGIAITSLPGIQMAINHPATVHQYGNGHGVFGYVTSNVNLTSVQVKVTNASTGAAVYNKTLTPNAKSYLIFNLDSEMTFAKWAKGKYTYTVIAKTASSSRTYQQSFEIASGWPATATQQSYVFTFNANGGTGAPAAQTVYFDGTLHIPASIPTREGYKFLGWYAMRNGDQTWYSAGNGWLTDAQLAAAGYTKRLYPVDTDFVINNSWVSGCLNTTGFTLYAQWEKTAPSTYTVTYNANGGSGAPASQTKTAGTALTLSSVKPARDGYTFLGWAASASGSAAYQPGAAFTTDANTTLYAVWQKGCENASHQYTYSVTAPTCTAGGYTTYTCTLCGDSYTEAIAATGHQETAVAAKAPTCTETGLTQGKLCSVCNEVLAAQTVVAALGHSYANGTCTRCGVVDPDAAVDDDEPQLVLDSKKTSQGGTVSVDLKVLNNPGFSVLNVAFLYDSQYLTLTSVENKVSSMVMTQDASVLWDSVVNYTADGVLATLNFAVAEDAPEGDYEIRVVFMGASNEDFEEVKLAAVSGVLTVSDVVYGDANGDGQVTTVDLAMLRKYLSGMDPITGISSVAVKAGADCNGDGSVNTIDLAMLRKYLAGMNPITGESSVVMGPK